MPNSRLAVTVVIPVKNEQLNLKRCLERLYQFQDVVVLDSGSTDHTREIAQSFGAKVLEFHWNGSFPKKRNWFLLNHAPRQPWVLFLDADEFVNDAFCQELADALTDTDRDGFWLNYQNFFLHRALNFGIPQRKLALFRVGKALYERIDEDRWSSLDMEVHEHPTLSQRIGIIRTPIEHHDFRGLGHFIQKHHDYAIWEAHRYRELRKNSSPTQHLTERQRFKYHNLTKWWFPWFYFLTTYIFRCGFLDGRAGFHYAFYKLWYFQTIRLLIREFDEINH